MSSHTAPAWQNNSRQIVRDLKEKFLENPNFYYQKKLEALGIPCGITQVTHFGEDAGGKEQGYLCDLVETKDITELNDEEFSNLIEQL